MANKIFESEVLPRDTALTIMNLISLAALKYPELSILYKNILVKDVLRHHESIIDMSVIYFCETQELLENPNLFKFYSVIKSYIEDIYGFSDYNIEFNYESILNNNGITLDENYYTYAHAYVSYLDEVIRAELPIDDIVDTKYSTAYLLSTTFKDLPLEEQLRLVYFSFVSCDYVTLELLKQNNNFIWKLIKENSTYDEINALFEFMLINFTNINNWQYETGYELNLGLEYILYLSQNVEIHNLLIEVLKPELRETYLSLIDMVK